MNQQLLKDETEQIFEKKPSNKYEGKVFKPSIADLVKQISKNMPATEKDSQEQEELVSDEERKDVAIGLEQVKTPEQEKELLNLADPRNNRDYFDIKYRAWARNNEHTFTNLASIRSKVCFWLGSTFVANPADKGVPDYIWYLPKDRGIVFNGHLNAKDYSQNDKNILQTNRYILELRDTMQKRIAFWFLIFGLAFGTFSWTATKVHDGYKYVSNKIAANGDKEKFKEQQLKTLEADAITLFEEYKAKKITDEQFSARKAELVAREKEINKQ